MISITKLITLALLFISAPPLANPETLSARLAANTQHYNDLISTIQGLPAYVRSPCPQYLENAVIALRKQTDKLILDLGCVFKGENNDVCVALVAREEVLKGQLQWCEMAREMIGGVSYRLVAPWVHMVGLNP